MESDDLYIDWELEEILETPPAHRPPAGQPLDLAPGAGVVEFGDWREELEHIWEVTR